MPFTIITDEMVGVNPNANYVYVSVMMKNGLLAKIDYRFYERIAYRRIYELKKPFMVKN